VIATESLVVLTVGLGLAAVSIVAASYIVGRIGRTASGSGFVRFAMADLG
jgi:hypothetical protein